MLVSVYIPTKNRLPLLKRAIDSVRGQNYTSIELIIVDDFSSDGTREFLADSQSHGLLKAILPEQPIGACHARNLAIRASTGYFVTGLDDDDYFSKPNKISSFVSAWNDAQNGIAGLFDSALLNTTDGQCFRSAVPMAAYQDLLISNYIGNQVFAPRHHFIEAGLFDPEMPAWQDWDLWIRMARCSGVFRNILLCGTVIDETHGHGRISTKGQDILREAMRHLAQKLAPLTIKERSYLISALHAYPQVRPTPSEVMTILAARRLKASIYSMKKLLTMPTLPH
jgi:glycosyltransferase involved in cell wall biosynthesis